ncbi:hypothetical protein TRFO_02798 [Tritrichomonas foetus]|uniref:Uncharacterized protein n=1 Tax=Tritrichomonas foetus TaxID=1144522 RepID=A0A1J4KW82_9EUKA|nr:hypothetical protein TRFO_02798 [Tritrichomonas foetus]|eukprot:OHT15491.1 hypothetical protein TRFO_02798 [Tritrichomonas foetus]
MLRWGIKEEFSEEIGNSILLCACPTSQNSVVCSSHHRTFVIKNSQIHFSLPIAFSAIFYIPSEDLVIASTVGIPCLQIFASANPAQFLLQEFMLHQPVVHQIYCSLDSNILVTIGAEIKVWDFKMIKGSTVNFEIKLRSHFKGSPLCNGMNLVKVDDKRHRIFVPHLNGFILYSFNGEILENQPNFSGLLFNAVAMLPTPRKYPGLDLSYQYFIDIYKKLVAVDKYGNIKIWHRSGKPLFMIPSISSAPVFYIEFINSEFVITVNTNGDIFINDLKTSKGKVVFKIDRKPDWVNFFTYPEPIILVIVSRKLYVFRLNIFWKLFYRPIQKVQSISRICSPTFSSRIGLNTSDGCLFLISPKTQELIGSASTKKCPRPSNYSYERECNETHILLAMDDSSVHLYDYSTIQYSKKENYRMNKYGKDIYSCCEKDWVLKQILPFKARLVFTVLGTEMLRWCVCTCGFFGDVVLYKYGTWEALGRVSVGTERCDYAFWCRKDNYMIVFCQDRINFIGLKKFSLTCSLPFPKPKYVAFEEGNLMVSYQHGILYQYTLSENGIISSSKCYLNNEIKYIHVRYGCHIIVLENNCIVIGNVQNMSEFLIELPYTISSAGFLSSDLDVLIALDHEIMFISKKSICPTLHPSLVPPNDLDNFKCEPLLPVKREVQMPKLKKSVDEEFESLRETSDDVLWRIRKKLAEDEENEFHFVRPKDFYNTPRRNYRPIVVKKESPPKIRERKPVDVIMNPKHTIDEGKHVILKPSQEVLVIDETFSFDREEKIPSIIAETDEELDSIYPKTVETNLNNDINYYYTNNISNNDSNPILDGDASTMNLEKVNLDEINDNIDLMEIKGSWKKLLNFMGKLFKSTNDLFDIEKEASKLMNNWSYIEKSHSSALFWNKTKNDLIKTQDSPLVPIKIVSPTETSQNSSSKTHLRKNKHKSKSKSQTHQTNLPNSHKNNHYKQHNESQKDDSDASYYNDYQSACSSQDLCENSHSYQRRNRLKKNTNSSSGKLRKTSHISFRNILASRKSHGNISTINLPQDMDSGFLCSTNSFDNVMDLYEREQQMSLRRIISSSSPQGIEEPNPGKFNTNSYDDLNSSLSRKRRGRLNNQNVGERVTLNSIQDDLFNSNESNYYEYENDFPGSKSYDLLNNFSKNRKSVHENTLDLSNSNLDLFLKKKSSIEDSNSKLQTQKINIRVNTNSLPNNSDSLSYNNHSNRTQNARDNSSNHNSKKNNEVDLHSQFQNSEKIRSSKNGKKSKKQSQNEAMEALLKRSITNKREDKQIIVREPPSQPNSNRRKIIKLDDSNNFSEHQPNKPNLIYQLLPYDEEEEDVTEEIIEPPKGRRQPLINNTALALYDPMDVPSVKLAINSKIINRQNMPQPKIKKETVQRKLIIKRQQISKQETKRNTRKSLFCNQ